MRTKAGFSLSSTTARELAAIAWATGKTHSQVVEEGVAAVRDGLSPEQRRGFEAALTARGTSAA